MKVYENNKGEAKLNDKRKATKQDVIMILLLLIVSIIGILILYCNKEPGKYVDIMVDGKTVTTLPLEDDTEYALKQKLGNNVIRITDGRVAVVSADCPDKICVNHSPIKNVGETIICLPHKVVVEIKQDK